MAEQFIELKHIKKSYVKDTPVIYDFNLKINKGEFVTFLGPSGCGKTTILRMLAGFESPTEGEILLRGEDISQRPPNERQINTVFQRYALFPHLNIYDNIAFGLRRKKTPKDIMDEKIKHVLEIVDLEGFEKRKISSLSGGQQQRIAIARAIVNEPEILLLDEPLGALDYKMRQEMQIELKRMHKELGITFVFVTHDQEEALTMSDKIVVMSKGMIQQVGTPEEIYSYPSNAFVADFIGESNIFNGKVLEGNRVTFAGIEMDYESDNHTGDGVDVMIRPEAMSIAEPGQGLFQGIVLDSTFKGKHFDITIASGKNEIYAQSKEKKEKGARVGVRVNPKDIHIMLCDIDQNRLVGLLDNEKHLMFVDGTIPFNIYMKIPTWRAEYREKLEGLKIELSFSPEDAQLSDDPEEGIFQGHIISIIYKGDHYNYRVQSRNKVEYSVDDEDLWNVGDYVSVIIPEEKMTYQVLDWRQQ